MPITMTPSAKYSFGCRVDGVDISKGIDAETYRSIESALHDHLVVCVSGQPYGPPELIRFAENFGKLEVNVAKSFHHGDFPQVTVLSNRIIDGKREGSPDAGQIWHTDMSYNLIAGRATILNAHMVPVQDGRVLGNTAFRDMHAAYEALPSAVRERIDGLEACHAFERNWNQMIARGSPRAHFTDAQRAEKPPVAHPVVLRHPWTGRKALYVNRGLTEYIVGLPEGESAELLNYLFDHQEREEFASEHEWRVGDTLIWDNCATLHIATGGIPADLPRVMIRTQVLGDEPRYRQANAPLGGRSLLRQSQQLRLRQKNLWASFGSGSLPWT